MRNDLGLGEELVLALLEDSSSADARTLRWLCASAADLIRRLRDNKPPKKKRGRPRKSAIVAQKRPVGAPRKYSHSMMEAFLSLKKELEAEGKTASNPATARALVKRYGGDYAQRAKRREIDGFVRRFSKYMSTQKIKRPKTPR